MQFGEDGFKTLLPSYLSDENKSRLKDALSQFIPEHKGNGKDIDYTEFYREYQHNYFLQSDLVPEIRVAHFNKNSKEFETNFTDAIIISNTCDISAENNRSVNVKQCLFAPIIDLKEYLEDLKVKGVEEEKIMAFSENVKKQLITNIFYLPPDNNATEYIALFDRVFTFSTEELNSYIEKGSVNDERIASLSHFGYYLFILKLSYHLCRLPEKCDREVA